MALLARCLLGLSAFAPLASADFFPSHKTEKTPTGPHVEFLFFNAEWCNPCQKMRPVVERLNHRGYQFRVIDVDQQRDLVTRYGISGIPAVVAAADGVVIDRITGVQTAGGLERFVYRAARSARASTASTAEPEIAGAVKVEPLLRVTYAVSEAKAEALIAFLKEHSAADFDAAPDGDTLRVIAAPEVRQALGHFLRDVVAAESAETSE